MHICKTVESHCRSRVDIFYFSLGIFTCPCYYYPNRAGGSGRASFVVGVELKTGDKSSDHWVKRGTALLMSLDD